LAVLLVLLVAARLAAAPVSMAVLLTWASVCLSHVTSHASGLPLDHGTMPSGPLESCRSKTHWLFDRWNLGHFQARQMMSLRCKWRCCLGALFRQANRWSPRASTTFPQPHVCGSHALQPSLISCVARATVVGPHYFSILCHSLPGLQRAWPARH